MCGVRRILNRAALRRASLGAGGGDADEIGPLLAGVADGVPGVRRRGREKTLDGHVPAAHRTLPSGAGARAQRAAASGSGGMRGGS